MKSLTRSAKISSAAAALAALCTLLAGCGGSSPSLLSPPGGNSSGGNSSGGNPQTGGTGGSPPGVVTRDGTATITIAASGTVTRLLPEAANFYKIEFLDTDNQQQVGVPLFNGGEETVVVPKGDPDRTDRRVPKGQEITIADRLFDVVSRPAAGQPVTRTYSGLPLKNLLLRVGAYRDNPIEFPDATTNPPLAQAEVAYLPRRRDPNNPDDKSLLSFALATTVEALEITGPEVVNSARAEVTDGAKFSGLAPTETGTYTVSARVGDAVALLPQNVLTGGQVSWTIDSVSGPQYSDLVEDRSGPTGLGKVIRGKGVLPGVIRLTVTDNESKKTAARLVRIEPLPGAVSLNLSAPPVGTQSVRVTFDRDDQDNPSAPNVAFVERWDTGLTLPKLALNQPLTPGKTNIKIEAFSREAARGSSLGVENASVYVLPGGILGRDPDDTNPDHMKIPVKQSQNLAFQATPTVSLVVLSGLRYDATISTGSRFVAIQGTPDVKDKTRVNFVGGQRYVLQVRVNGETQPADRFEVAFEDGDGKGLREGEGDVPSDFEDIRILPEAGTTDHYVLQMVSLKNDSVEGDVGSPRRPPVLKVREATAGKRGREVYSTLPELKADLGGQVNVGVR